MHKSMVDHTHLITSSSLHHVNKSETVVRYRAESARFLQLLIIITITLLPGIAGVPCISAADTTVIRVGSELEFPPYAFVDGNGQAAGFSVDLIKAVTGAMGLSMKISTGTWDAVWNDLVNGRIDLLPIVAKLPERTTLVDFSLPHTETYDSFFVREGSKTTSNIEEAGGKEIAVMRSDAAHLALMERNFQGQLVLVDTIPEGLSLIASGKHDAFLCSKLIGTLVIRKHGIKGLTAGPPIPDYKRVFSFAVRKGDTELLEKLNQGLLIVKANGEYQRIYDKWLTIDDPWQKYRKYLMPFIWIVTAFALIGIVWLVMLKRLVSKRTRELSERNEMLSLVRDGLDKTVAERTKELSSLNAALMSEIAERKQVENTLRKHEQKYRDLFDYATDAIFILDLEGNFIDVNKTAYTRLGYTKQEMLSLHISRLDPPEFAARVPERLAQIAQHGKAVFESAHVKKDGSVMPVEVNSRLLDYEGKKVYFSVIRDITERKRAEEALRKSEERLRLAVYGGSVGIWEWDVATNKLDWNDQLKEIFGLPVSTSGLTLEKFMSAIYPDDLAVTEHSFRMALEHHTEFKHEYRIIWPDGSLHWIVAIGRGIYDPGGLPLRMLGCALDITGSKQAELKYKTILDTAMDCFYIIDAQQGNILEVNDAYCSLIGYSRTELLKMSLRDIEASENPEQIAEHMQFIMKNGADRFETRHRAKDGIIHDMETSVNYMREANQFFVFMHDITGRNQAEEEKETLQAQLLQAQKMEAIGHLAGGVAHDFNNALTAIIGFAYILRNRLKEDGQLAQNAEQIISVSNRAALTVSSLLAFSRKQVMQMKSVNINNIVSGMIEILDRIIGEDIYLRVNTAVHDLIVNVDTNQIEQVIMNLTTNARDAMPGGGTLTVTTEEIEIDEHYIHMHLEGEAGKYAVLSVTDTGMGMDEKTRENIFDPFFTTKEVGKGTGLGLAMIYGTIKQHNGVINVYSEPGRGTNFKIYLPMAGPGVKAIEEKEAGPAPSGTETVLLVEDDENVRIVTRALLEEYGYSVIEAADGKRAVELFRENRDRVHLVITDIIMPGQSGKDLHNELMMIAADIKVIYVSGYPADVLAKKGFIDSDVNFISKPVNPEVLLQKIREVLEK